MITLTYRLDRAVRTAAWAHEKAKQHRKGSDLPYIIHPFGVMIIASGATDNEDVLVACLLHDVLEDVGSEIYTESDMGRDFGENVLAIVKHVTNNANLSDWRERSEAYLEHLKLAASQEALIVSAADKIHNSMSVLMDYQQVGDALWARFTTKNSKDQLWWYESILAVLRKRQAPIKLVNELEENVIKLRAIINN